MLTDETKLASGLEGVGFSSSTNTILMLCVSGQIGAKMWRK